MKITLAIAWIVLVVFLGYAAAVTSVTTWAMLAVVACAPPLVVRHFWHVPAESTSESIRDAIR